MRILESMRPKVYRGDPLSKISVYIWKGGKVHASGYNPRRGPQDNNAVA